MKHYLSSLFFVFLIGVIFAIRNADAQTVNHQDTFSNLAQIENLPYLTEGTRIKQVSPHDRSGGGGDGYDGKHSFQYMDPDGKFVIFDEMGPGVVTRMVHVIQDSFLANAGTMSFQFDDEPTPRISLPFADFFSGTHAPFFAPLVGKPTISSGAFYSYYPLYFKKRLRILTTGRINYFDLTYQLFNKSDWITSSTGKEEYADVRQIQNAAGADPKSATSNLSKTGTATIFAGQTKTLEELSGTGVIQSIKIDPSPATDITLNATWLKIYWDNRTDPSVNAPLGQFFGSQFGEKNWKSLLLGMNTNGMYYSYFPMPYWTNAKITIQNTSNSTITIPYEIQYKSTAYSQNAGYFYATYHQETPTTLGKDYTFLETTGKGNIVGITHSMQGADPIFDEGDERIRIDDNKTAHLYGTQTDHFYNSGWSWNYGTVNLPLHGAIFKDFKQGDNKVSAYRFMVSDTIPFENTIHLGIEHAKVNNDHNANYYSVVYYYKKDEPGLKLTDSIDIGSTQPEASHIYSITNQLSENSQVFAYESDQDGIDITDNGRAHKGTSEFRITIDPKNTGVRLRRRMNYHIKNQMAKIYVDGTQVGIWYSSGENENLKNNLYWRDEEFEIPPQYTQNKSALTIKTEYTGNADEWNEYYYWIYSYMPIASAIPTTPTPFQLAIQQASFNTSFTPWVISLTGTNLNIDNGPFTASLFSSNGTLWKDNISVAASNFISLSLPSNTGPGGCNIGISTCQIQVQVRQTSSGILSNKYTITLPQVDPNITSEITPTYLRSDFGGLGGAKDGKVDIQDFNILAGEFYLTGTTLKSNIINTGLSTDKVDIQDYNAFVGDYQAYLAR